jgi:hypothetical protein
MTNKFNALPRNRPAKLAQTMAPQLLAQRYRAVIKAHFLKYFCKGKTSREDPKRYCPPSGRG